MFFNKNGEDVEGAFVRGSWDFAFHVLQPALRLISNPESKTALEIGHGGGRLLAAASRFFGEALGVDIHDHNHLVTDILHSQGIKNFGLLQGQRSTLDIPDASVDFVYSFIVFQHVEHWSIMVEYFNEISRVLRPSGVGVIYVGRRAHASLNRSSVVLCWMDRVAEYWRLGLKGYEEVTAEVNSTNLRVAMWRAKRLARDSGLTVKGIGVSRKKMPDGIRIFGGQHCLVLGKD
ncbi:MAG: hypothetical protein K940chlam6_01486 [Chlamydiae bacterium]|nr:hypothetical protein [Chlamydiota bacterium]